MKGLTREEELAIFRNVNGANKTWELSGVRVSYVNSSREMYLRQNQGKAKSKFIKFVIKEGFGIDYWKGV